MDTLAKKACILGFNWSNTNYGALLTIYALQEFLSSQNLHCDVINITRNCFKMSFDNYNALFDDGRTDFTKFKEKYLNLTNPINSFEDLRKLNLYYDTFILGSDTTLAPGLFRAIDGANLFNFTLNNKRRIAYSSSFGDKNPQLTEFESIEYGIFLSRFTAISVRESSAKSYLSEQLQLDSQHVVDPVFLLPESFYSNFIKDTPIVKCRIVGYFVQDAFSIDNTKEYTNLYGSNLTINEFVSMLYHTEHIITSSFHALCFAIIFRKRVTVIYSNSKLATLLERIKSLFNMLNLPFDKVLISDTLVDFEILENNAIDLSNSEYDYVYSKLEHLIHNSKNFLYNSILNKEVKIFSDDIYRDKLDKFLNDYIN